MELRSRIVPRILLFVMIVALTGRPIAVVLHNHLAHCSHAITNQAKDPKQRAPGLKRHFHELRKIAKRNPRPKSDLLPPLVLARVFNPQKADPSLPSTTERRCPPMVTLRI